MRLRDGFYDDEVICGYTVTSKTKRVWEIQLTVLEYVINICKENGWRVYAWGGTLLGAVRHKGFIPWDDNVDVAMPREDFEKLSRYLDENVNQKESDYVYEYIGIGSPSCKFYGKLSYRNSICIYNSVDCSSYNGIALAIHPMDDTSDNVAMDIVSDRDLRSTILKSTKSVYNSHLEDPSHVIDIYNHRHKPRQGSGGYVLLHRCRVNRDEVFSKTLFKDVMEMDFECLKVPVPSGYDTILTSLFGDYMTPREDDSRHDYVKYVSSVESWENYRKYNSPPVASYRRLPIDLDLPDSFFQPYTFSNGYKVAEYKRCLDAVMLDLLKKVTDLCDRLGIRYFLDGGTLLGAVRDQGIIPWDDDIDIALFREDYDRLVDAFNREYENTRYFLCKVKYDRMCRVMNTQTTHLGSRYVRDGVNAIGIDIFPLDPVPVAYADRLKMYEDKKECTDGADVISARYDTSDSNLSGIIAISNERREFIRTNEYYENAVKMTLEGFEFTVPYMYEKCCEQQYGKRWRNYVVGYSLHSSYENCPHIPYSRYFDYYPDINSLINNIE